MAQMLYDDDAALEVLDGKTIAVIGYGTQGHAHARNLKEPGLDVVVGLYAGSRSAKDAEAAGIEVLADIQDGTFARDWILENQANQPAFRAHRRQQARHPIEQVGRELRSMMSWLPHATDH